MLGLWSDAAVGQMLVLAWRGRDGAGGTTIGKLLWKKASKGSLQVLKFKSCL